MIHIYLHGFASGANSYKGRFFREKMQNIGLELHLVDLNIPSFNNMTISSQTIFMKNYIESLNKNNGFCDDICLWGSSLGGLLAVICSMQIPQIKMLVLMAPAFQFQKRWHELLGEKGLKKWIETKELRIFHYEYKKEETISPDIFFDMQKHNENSFNLEIKTLLIHGRKDEVVSIDYSRNFVSSRPHIKFIELESEHTLADALDDIWEYIYKFIS